LAPKAGALAAPNVEVVALPKPPGPPRAGLAPKAGVGWDRPKAGEVAPKAGAGADKPKVGCMPTWSFSLGHVDTISNV